MYNTKYILDLVSIMIPAPSLLAMGYRPPFQINPNWSFPEFLDNLFAYYRGGGIQSTGYRLNHMRNWLSMSGCSRAIEAIRQLEDEAESDDEAAIAASLWMSVTSYRRLKKFVNQLPDDRLQDQIERPLKAFVSYKWESGEHVAWVRKLAASLRNHGIDAILDQWEVRYG